MGELLIGTAAALLVFCAPGYPGASGDAQPLVDEFAAAAAGAANWPAGSLAAAYDASEQGGLTKLASPDAAIAFVPFPFFVEHAAMLHLEPLLQADVQGVGTRERWTLVGKRAGAGGSTSLAGYTLASTAGYAPQFVRRFGVGSFALPEDVKINATGQVLSALRSASAGERIVVLLDQEQMTASASLPFAAQLATLAQSTPVPVAIIALVDGRLGKTRAESMRAGLLKLGMTDAGKATLGRLRLNGFVAPELPAHAVAP
jgi:hypothetical protein